eukprot:scaffold4165_cov194-Ochromonas_danica.AAC.6
MGLLENFRKIVGGGDPTESLIQENDKQLSVYLQSVEKINALEEEYERLSDDELRYKTTEFRKRLSQGETLDDLLVEVFAVVREAAWRVLELRPFDVQLIGGMALHDGRLAEMATGEGKTLVAVLPATLHALSQEGSVFIVTTNDYLARRDGETMGQIFKFLGLTVGIIQSSMKESQRKEAYSADITYLSNQELGFDYLRDNLAMSQENIVQLRPFAFCIVDEADSILIDEAKTPLIISRKGTAMNNKYLMASEIAKNLVSNIHTCIACIIRETNGRYERIGRVLESRRFSEGIQQAIEAKEGLPLSSETQVVAKVTYQNLFRLFPRLSGMSGTAWTDCLEFLDIYNLKVLPIPTALPVVRRDYPDAVFRNQDGKMKALLRNIITNHEKGRPILVGTVSVQASEDLAQALKDLGVKAQVLNARPDKIEKEAEIISQAGRLGAVTVATNLAGRGTDIILGGSAKGTAKALAKYLLLYQAGLVEINEEDDEVDIVDHVSDDDDEDDEEEEEAEGEDSIISTETATPSQQLQEEEEEVTQVEGKNEVEEEEEEDGDEEVVALPTLKAVARHLGLTLPCTIPRKIELQLQRSIAAIYGEIVTRRDHAVEGGSINGGNSGSSGSGSSQQQQQGSFDRVSLEEIIALAAEGSLPPATSTSTSTTPVSSGNTTITTATTSSEGGSAMNDLRKAIASLSRLFESIYKEDRETVRRLGGLYVIGTTRHDSRRIDNQLRGRCGRQGDPGSTRFFLSLEDEIFRVFGANKMAGLLESFRIAEDMPLEDEMVTKALNTVQEEVEKYYYQARKKVYQIDSLANSQRNALYTQRRAFLTSSDEGMITLFKKYCMATMDEIYQASTTTTAAGGGGGGHVEVNVDKLVSKAKQFFPNIRFSVEEGKFIQSGATGIGGLLPILHDRLEEAIVAKQQEIDQVSAWAFVAFFRYLALIQVDELWCKHLTRLEVVKEEVSVQAFTGDRDPLEVYRERASKLFTPLMDEMRRNTVYSIFIYNPNNSPTTSKM